MRRFLRIYGVSLCLTLPPIGLFVGVISWSADLPAERALAGGTIAVAVALLLTAIVALAGWPPRD